MTEKAHSIGDAVRVRRVELRLSQRDLAGAAGTTAAAISHIERGLRNPSSGLLVRLAGVLQCSADNLLSGAVAVAEGDPHIRQVVAAMKSFPPAVQKEVVDFCHYQMHRQNRHKT